MSAIAEVLSSDLQNAEFHGPAPRVSDLPSCAVCADTMIAAEASAFLNDGFVSYLWTCENCGYGFVTRHALKRIACS